MAHQSIFREKLKVVLKLANNVIWSFDFRKKKKKNVLGLRVVREIICDERRRKTEREREKKRKRLRNFSQSVTTKHSR